MKFTYFLIKTKVKIEKFINFANLYVRIQVKDFIVERQLLSKIGKLTMYLLEVMFTGGVIYYAITNFNWISCGILSALSMYYIEWFVNLVKEKKQ